MAVEKTNLFVGKMMAYVSIVCVVVISLEVIMRYVFGMPTNWGHELMYSLFAMYYVMVVGVVHYWRAHVRVDVLYAIALPPDPGDHGSDQRRILLPLRLRLHLDLLELLLELPVMTAGNTFLGIEIPGEASFTDWAPPLYPVKFLMPFGGVLLAPPGDRLDHP